MCGPQAQCGGLICGRLFCSVVKMAYLCNFLGHPKSECLLVDFHFGLYQYDSSEECKTNRFFVGKSGINSKVNT